MCCLVQLPAGVAGVHLQQAPVGVGCVRPVVGVLPGRGVGCFSTSASVLQGAGRQEHDPGWGVPSDEKA